LTLNVSLAPMYITTDNNSSSWCYYCFGLL